MTDKQVREKMEGLDPLTGGVVFGKEEAWARLQGRMETKPARRLLLWQRLAAAAVLLLFVSIGLWYYRPAKEIAVNQPTAQPVPADKEAMAVSVPAVTEPAIQRPAPSVPATRKQEHTRERYVIEVPSSVPVADTVPAIPATAIVNTTVLENLPPAKKMKVVHINDLDAAVNERTYAAQSAGPSLDMQRIKVVSLYDLQREEQVWQSERDVTGIVRTTPQNSFLVLPGRIRANTRYIETNTPNPLTLRFHNSQNQ